MVEVAATEATLRTVAGGWSTAAGGRCQPCQREGGVGGAAGMGRMCCASSSMAHGRDSGENPRGREGWKACRLRQRCGAVLGSSPEQGVRRIGAKEIAGAGHGAQPRSRRNKEIREQLAEAVSRLRSGMCLRRRGCVGGHVYFGRGEQTNMNRLMDINEQLRLYFPAKFALL
jgi:hypothetical protein